MSDHLVHAHETNVFPRMLDLAYPSIERGDGVRLFATDGREILDACSGGAMVACLGHGVQEIVDAATEQAERVSYVYNHHFTNDRQEELADRLLGDAAPEMARVRFVSGGSEANETALRLARSYHVERGDEGRWRILSPGQAYHGATFASLALTGRPSLHEPYGEYLSPHLHLRSGDLDELERVLGEHGGEVAAFVCEPVSGAAHPAYSPPDEFWLRLGELRERLGFLVVFDEIVSGMGRTGSWFAYQDLPIEPDIVTAGKGLGCGYFPVAAALCKQHVYDAIANGSRLFDLGHTWDGAPLPCAVGLATIEYIEAHGLVGRVRERGPRVREDIQRAVGDLPLVREVRGRGFLLGVELVDPRDGCSPLPAEVDAASMVDWRAFEHGLLTTSSHASADGLFGDQVLLAPAYTTTDEDLELLVERLRATLEDVQGRVEKALAGTAS
jgi:adenosylmethionine-8-amino-7-oxononanoate aminotransferase